MDNVHRFREVLNLLSNSSTLAFPTLDKDHRYAMDDDGHIGCLKYDFQNSRFTDEMITLDYNYNEWLDLVSNGYKEFHDDIFNAVLDGYTSPPALVITTNGDLNKDGYNVMGKGIVLEFKNRYPQLPQMIGSYIKQFGNRAFHLGVFTFNLNGHNVPIRIFTCPTKHSWKDSSDLTLITQSIQQIIDMCNKFRVETVFLPVPGCGNGGLNYTTTVKPVLELLLDERFYVCFKD